MHIVEKEENGPEDHSRLLLQEKNSFFLLRKIYSLRHKAEGAKASSPRCIPDAQLDALSGADVAVNAGPFYARVSGNVCASHYLVALSIERKGPPDGPSVLWLPQIQAKRLNFCS